MLQTGKHGMVVSVCVIAEKVDVADAGIESKTLYRGDGILFVLEIGMTRKASLISQGHYKLVAQVVLRVQRVVLGIHGGKIRGIGGDANLTGSWQTVRAKTNDRIRVRGIAEERLRIARNCVDNTRIWGSRRGEGKLGRHRTPRVI